MAAGRQTIVLDVSSNNGAISFAKVKREGIGAVYVKATEGTGWIDPDLDEHVSGARKAKLPVGLYHYARPDTGGDIPDATKEAHGFIEQLEYHDWQLLPALDFEEPRAVHLGVKALNAWAHRFCVVVSQYLETECLFYSYPNYIASGMGGAPALYHYPLWLAAYGPNDGDDHGFKPIPGFQTILHQYTSNAHVNGVHGTADLSKTQHGLTPLKASKPTQQE